MIRKKQEIGKYLSGENYQIGTIIDLVVLDEGKEVPSQFTEKDGSVKNIFELGVHIENVIYRGKPQTINDPEKIYQFGLSGYNENMIIDQLGENSSEWIGSLISVIVETSSKAKSGKRLSVIVPEL